MYKLMFLSLALFLSLSAFAQSENMKYDKALADSLGGDQYGMKMYTLVMLRTGTSTIENKAVVDSLFGGHMANINKLVGNSKDGGCRTAKEE
jgi:hypothetical protein